MSPAVIRSLRVVKQLVEAFGHLDVRALAVVAGVLAQAELVLKVNDVLLIVRILLYRWCCYSSSICGRLSLLVLEAVVLASQPLTGFLVSDDLALGLTSFLIKLLCMVD